MAESTQASDDSQLHWFWKLTTKWWFFPVLYITLSLLVMLTIVLFSLKKIGGISDFFSLWMLIILFMPSGIFAIINLLLIHKTFFTDGLAVLGYLLPGALIHVFHITLIIVIYRAWKNKRKLLRWLILTLFFLMILEFSGCVLTFWH